MTEPTPPTVSTTGAELPERPAEASTNVGEEPGPSKNAIKKAAKDAEKAARAAERQKKEQAQKEATDANDVSKDDYGDLPVLSKVAEQKTGIKRTTLAELVLKYGNESTVVAEEEEVILRLTVENARNQSAKLCFVTLAQSGHTIQGVVAASETISRQMVKFCASLPTESVVLVQGVIKKPNVPINSATISHLELHIRRLFVECRADVQLPMQVADAERPIPAEGEETVNKDEERPTVSLSTRLNNRVIDLRARHNRAIFKIKHGVVKLFREFLESKDFIGVQTPKLLGSASEGGANVFKVSYFHTEAFLAQSPQLYKQMLIASRMERVYEIGPVFRAENSNTARHLTEFTGLDLEMEFQEHYHEVVDLLEELMLFIFNGLKERYKSETDLIRSIYHVEEFKLPEVGKTVRLPFAEGIRMLKEDGVDVGEFDDLRYLYPHTTLFFNFSRH